MLRFLSCQTVFGLEFSDTGRRNLRPTEPQSPYHGQNSINRRLKRSSSHFGHQAKRHVELWGIPGFRMLINHLKSQAVKEVTDSNRSNVFLIAVEGDAQRR